ncbi:MAG: prepilin-type N-terminal cleavage/methylation domain-containing protein [Terrimicrobiaceae bacterium]|nr:prepilin-type N-terminal cleavage/methylation domain-containing protein [Terrimicrobiaceae bacterium]
MSRAAAYSLIEVLVASAILMIAVSAAAALALATVAQEETNARIARCINLHEQAVRLYQLGLDGATIVAILPQDPAVTALPDFTQQGLQPVANLGTVQQSNTTLTFTTSDAAAAAGQPATRTSSILAIRPSIR